MPFPAIKYCLVCEDVRLERRKLASLLGFYGVAPDVEIVIQDLSKPMERLAFLLVGEGGGGKFRVSLQFISPEGKNILNVPTTELEIPPGSRRQNLVLGIGSLRFPSAGKYEVVIIVDDKPHYRTSLGIKQGKPEDFQ